MLRVSLLLVNHVNVFLFSSVLLNLRILISIRLRIPRVEVHHVFSIFLIKILNAIDKLFKFLLHVNQISEIKVAFFFLIQEIFEHLLIWILILTQNRMLNDIHLVAKYDNIDPQRI